MWAIIPFGKGLAISDFSLGILYTLALSSLGVYGILFAGWSANSKYAFLGSLRSTAAMVSYELILSSAILIIIFLTGSFNFTNIIEIQQPIWFIVPLFPVFIFYFISVLAETSRTPFDLQEAKPYKCKIKRTISQKFYSNLLYKHSSIKVIKYYYHTQPVSNSIYDEKDNELVVLLIKKLSLLGLKNLNSHMLLGKPL